jgi:hypothetical protein
MNRKKSIFNPRYYTIKDLEAWGIRIESVEQQGHWLAVKTEGQFHTMQPGKSPYNQYGDHVAIHSVTIKIRMK